VIATLVGQGSLTPSTAISMTAFLLGRGTLTADAAQGFGMVATLTGQGSMSATLNLFVNSILATLRGKGILLPSFEGDFTMQGTLRGAGGVQQVSDLTGDWLLTDLMRGRGQAYGALHKPIDDVPATFPPNDDPTNPAGTGDRDVWSILA
jgi:hypothetical protein